MDKNKKIKILMASLFAISIFSFVIAFSIFFDTEKFRGEFGDKFEKFSREFQMHIDFNDFIDDADFLCLESSFTTDIRFLEIKAVSSDINVEGYDGDKITLSSLENVYCSTKKANTLTIKIPKDVDNLTIKVPKNIIEEIDFKSVSGDGQLNNLKSEKIDLKTTSGSYKTVDLDTDSFKFKSTSGSLDSTKLKSRNVDIKTVSGNIYIYFDSLLKSLNGKSVSGDFKILMAEGNKIDADIKSVSGYLRNEFGAVRDAEVYLNIKSVSGDVNISKK